MPTNVEFQWKRNDEIIWGSTGPTYYLRSADKGAKITVVSTVVYPDSEHRGDSITSNPVTVR